MFEKRLLLLCLLLLASACGGPHQSARQAASASRKAPAPEPALDSLTKLIRANRGFVFADRIDTVLRFGNLAGGGCRQALRLNQRSARAALYQYAAEQGYLVESSALSDGFRGTVYQPVDDGSDSALLEVSYDTLLSVRLNDDDCADAVISYWLMPPLASGTCYVPQHAMLVSTPRGYRILNPGFIPESYTIDSAGQGAKGEAVLYGREFDCGNKVDLRPFRVAIRSAESR